MFPINRLRRLRINPLIRKLTQENRIHIEDFIYPLFVVEGINIKNEIKSMPGIYHQSIDVLLKECESCLKLGLKNILLFAIPNKNKKNENGSIAWNNNGIIQKTIRILKKNFTNNILIISDLCFCEYTSHGHCGILKNEILDNDATLEILKKQALSHAENGVDMIAPSGMIDGMILNIRAALDKKNFEYLPIISYSSKYASSYYGPFREAVESNFKIGNRKNYQMNPANRLEAYIENKLDVKEGADILMVKPALAYLDIIRDLKNEFKLPIAAYNVSGEYSIIKAGSKLKYIDEKKLVLETMLSFKRAGADIIISYFAKNIATWLKNTAV